MDVLRKLQRAMRARWEADFFTCGLALGSIFPPQTLSDIHNFSGHPCRGMDINRVISDDALQSAKSG
jgi:hypothetical protein